MASDDERSTRVREDTLRQFTNIDDDVRDREAQLERKLRKLLRAHEDLSRSWRALQEQNVQLSHRVAEQEQIAGELGTELESLRRDVLTLLERERQRIADVLHDHLQQLLLAAHLELSMIQRGIQGASLDRLRELLEEAIDVTRTLSAELSPAVLRRSGLAAALEWLTRRMEHRFGLKTTFEIELDAEPTDSEIRSTLFHASRELLLNVHKHAETDEARIVLEPLGETHICLKVVDAGKGFDADASGEGTGLTTLHERLHIIGGKLVVDSTPGEGTTVELHAPRQLAGSEEEEE